MATVEFTTATGFTDLTLYLYPHGSDTLANPGGDACTERTNAKGIYSATVAEALTGLHDVVVKDSIGSLIATYHVDLDVVVGIYYCGDWFYANLVQTSAAVNSAIAAAVASESSPEIASAVAEELIADHPTVGSIAQTLSRLSTYTAAQIQAIVDGTSLTLMRGDTISFSLTGLGNIATRTKLWITGKSAIDATDTSGLTDANADFQILEVGGLQRISGAAPTVSQTGTITVTNAVTGAITVTLSAAASAALGIIRRGKYDVQVLDAVGVRTLVSGVLNITADVTEAVS